MKRAAVGILLASLFTATAAMAGQGNAAQRADWDSRNDHSDRRDDRNDHDNGRGNDRGRDERRNDDRDYRGHDRVVVRHAPAPVRYVRAPAPVRYGVYHPPRGFYDHSWRRGERLPVAYYQRPYVIADYNSYRLYSPPRGYHWVRVNHDAVLAGITTGVVFGIVNNLFH
jgi:Ni/Co efflux regulator RcnB